MSERSRYLGSAGCMGAAIALFVYRFVVMGLVWDSPTKHVLEIGAVALVIVGNQLRRKTSKDDYPVAWMLVAAVLSFGVAFGICFAAITGVDDARLTTRELPGFSIGLPSGTEDKTNTTYGDGAVQINAILGTGDVVRVGWEAGQIFDESAVDMVAKGLGAMAHSPLVHGTGPHGKPTIAFTIDSTKGALHMIVTTCGVRRIMIMSTTEKLAQRMLATLQCHPDPAQEGAVDTVPWTATLPAGWYQLSAIKGQLWLTNGTDVLMARTVESMPDRAAAPHLFQQLMTAAGLDMTVDGWADDRYPLHATIDGKRYSGFIMPFDCRSRAVLLLAFAADESTLEPLSALAKQSRCLAEGEAPPQWPAKPKH